MVTAHSSHHLANNGPNEPTNNPNRKRCHEDRLPLMGAGWWADEVDRIETFNVQE
jgi:hypothetical protein